MRSKVSWSLLFVAALVGPACSGGGDDGDDTSTSDSGDTANAGTTWEDVRPIVERRCARCHSADRLSTYRPLETHLEVSALRASIMDKISESPSRGQRMPLTSNHVDDSGCTPEHAQVDDKRLTDDEHAMLMAYLQRTDHQEYEDTTDPIQAPVVPPLADSVSYQSTQYDVLNDGFVTPPDGVSDDYMADLGYDDRDYDQMEDDWFCIQFDPELTDDMFVTGLQVETEIGQIFLHSQLVIDTNGSSDAARQAADEKGQDWYKCDAGLGFTESIPLWRTAPGGAAIELPEGVGLSFESDWRFVLRADFHTHFDAEEFNRLDQNGVIDYEAGTMTWFDRATLRVRWAEASEVQRELQWLTVGPSTPEQRDTFEVPTGQSQLSYAATVPSGADYRLFSAEVGMGKNGKTASLTSSDSTCLANNSDFSPKWIEQSIYAEDDSPTLTGGTEVQLACHYRNSRSGPVDWGAESEATVWGRRERCSGVLWFYEQ